MKSLSLVRTGQKTQQLQLFFSVVWVYEKENNILTEKLHTKKVLFEVIL